MVPNLLCSTSNASEAVVVREVEWTDAPTIFNVVDQVFRARETLSGVGIPVSVNGAGNTVSVLVERCWEWAVLTGSVVGVPDLLGSTGNASDTVVVREVSWADTSANFIVVDQVFWARKALSRIGIPVGVNGAGKALTVGEKRCWE